MDDGRAGEFAIIERGASEPTPWEPEERRMSDTQRGGVLADVELPDFGMPATEPLLPPTIYAERLERLRPAWTSGATTTSSCGPTASTAPTSPTSPGSTRGSRRPCSSSSPRATRRCSSATSASARRGGAAAAAAASASRTSACPASRATRRCRCAEILAAEGIAVGSRVGVVGWKTYASRETIEAPAFLVDELRRATGRRASWRTPPTCSSTPPTGCVINEVEQLAAFEWAACQTSHGVRNLVAGLRRG